MAEKFNFKSTIKDIQNRLVAENIRDTSNLQLLKSEEAIRSVIKSYVDKFNSAEGMLTSMAEYVVKSTDVVETKYFNDLMKSLYIDMYSLYNNISNLEVTLDLNLDRNRNYFLTIKKKIKNLWNRLNLTRLNIYDQSPSDESYYESFNTVLSAKYIENINIDKKTSMMTLKVDNKRNYNNGYNIKSVDTVIYPVDNPDGGVEQTTNTLNTYEYNMKYAKRDMLMNGLWKEELICSDMPDMVVNIGSATTPINKEYKGAVALIDITFAKMISLNRLNFDIFGEYPLTIDSILYKNETDDDWSQLTSELVEDFNNFVKDSADKSVYNGTAFDILTALNLTKINTNMLRIVVNQKHYDIIDGDDVGESSISLQIEKDLSERRYDLIKFGADLDDSLDKPINDYNRSLYDKIIEAIFSTRDIAKILLKINKILIPEVNISTINFSKSVKYEMGLWSLEPILEQYSNSIGKYDSTEYKIGDRNLISARIKSKQTMALHNTCNWYINIGDKNIPIIENYNEFVKEPINAVNPAINDWDDLPGIFVNLNFPIDPTLSDYIYLYVNGVATKLRNYCWLNSKLIYIDDITNNKNADYVIKYYPAHNESIVLYILNAISNTNIPNDISTSLISSNRNILQSFMSKATLNNVTLNTYYDITPVIATKSEAKGWFGDKADRCIFIDDSMYSNIAGDISLYTSIINRSESKLDFTSSDITNYINNGVSGSVNLELINYNKQNIAPLNIVKEI